MANVYSHSACNIAATGALNADKGLFFDTTRKSGPAIFNPLGVMLRTANGKSSTAISGKETFESTPLLRRGWVVQERLLASNTLHFGKTQLS